MGCARLKDYYLRQPFQETWDSWLEGGAARQCAPKCTQEGGVGCGVPIHVHADTDYYLELGRPQRGIKPRAHVLRIITWI